MSATRDRSQNASFVFTSIYHLYQREKSKQDRETGLLKAVVLKTPEVSAISSEDQESLSSWVRNETRTGRKNLGSHLRELRETRKKLSFMLQELDDLLKRD